MIGNAPQLEIARKASRFSLRCASKICGSSEERMGDATLVINPWSLHVTGSGIKRVSSSFLSSRRRISDPSVAPFLFLCFTLGEIPVTATACLVRLDSRWRDDEVAEDETGRRKRARVARSRCYTRSAQTARRKSPERRVSARRYVERFSRKPRAFYLPIKERKRKEGKRERKLNARFVVKKISVFRFTLQYPSPNEEHLSGHLQELVKENAREQRRIHYA